MPLQSLPTFHQIDGPAQLEAICKLTEGALGALLQTIDKGIKQSWAQYWTLRNTTGYQPPLHLALLSRLSHAASFLLSEE